MKLVLFAVLIVLALSLSFISYGQSQGTILNKAPLRKGVGLITPAATTPPFPRTISSNTYRRTMTLDRNGNLGLTLGKLGYPTEKKYVGVIAQEMQGIAPYTADSFRAKLNPGDQTESDILRFDPSALTYITISAIKELDSKVAEIKQLREEVDELKLLVKSMASKAEFDNVKRIGRASGRGGAGPEDRNDA